MIQPRLENELLRLAPRMDNSQTVMCSLNQKCMVHHRPGDRLDNSQGNKTGGALSEMNMYKSLNKAKT